MKILLLVVAGSLGLAWQAPAAEDSSIAAACKGQLVSLSNKRLAKFDDSALAPVKYYGIYYSASWCGPCRMFTPKLVEWYQRTKPANPHFELIFVSDDNSEPDMAKYMTDDKMKWPALDFKRKGSNSTLTHYAGSGIPDLVFVDAQGKVLADSFEGKNYVGPQQVLAFIDKTLHENKPSAEAIAAAQAAAQTKKGGAESFNDFFKKKPADQPAPAAQ